MERAETSHPAASAQALRCLKQQSPSSCVRVQWGVLEVGHFLEALGFEAYCRRFRHHMVDGPTLLGLTDAQLKVRARPGIASSSPTGVWSA